jgi:hypothetical protein
MLLKPLDRTPLPHLARGFAEQTLLTQEVVIVLRESVGFVANRLAKFEPKMLAPQANRIS